MKTAISLPDDLFKSAEKKAKQLGISRSELYSRAISELLVRTDSVSVTEQLNEVYLEESARVDDVLHLAQILSLGGSDW